MGPIESHRVPDPCCHSCLALIAMYNLRHSIKAGNKTKKVSVHMFGPWIRGLRRFSEREEGGKRERREWGKGETKEEHGKGGWKRKGKGEESPSTFVCRVTLCA